MSQLKKALHVSIDDANAKTHNTKLLCIFYNWIELSKNTLNKVVAILVSQRLISQ